MPNFSDEIFEDIHWRMAEIATAKSLPYRYGIPEQHRTFLIKHSVPIIYATWEGFVRNSIGIYARALNRTGLNIHEFSANIISNSIEVNFPQIKEPISNYDQTIKFVGGLFCYIGSDFRVSTKVPVSNNINLKVLNSILHRFSIKPIHGHRYESGLNKLLKFRNSIAHGDSNIVIDNDIISEFSILVNDLMTEVFNNMEHSYFNKSYRS